ncbi:MAG: hypothetical protein H0Z33_11670 [Bacillaceae bacterium]|nr:hypothetical protein [Bacillaceae bacterium]
MNLSRTQAGQILQAYDWKVYRGRPHQNGILLETNKGKKQINFWHDRVTFTWSYMWREELARSGYRTVERFLPTRNNRPGFVMDQWIVAATDYYSGISVDHRKHRDHYVLGKVLGRLHKTLEKLKNHRTMKRIESVWKKNNTFEIFDVRPLPQPENKHNFTSGVEARIKKSLELSSKVHLLRKHLPLSHAGFSGDNLIRISRQWYLTGFHNPSLKLLHHDTSHAISHIYQNSEWNLDHVAAFIKGYRTERQLSREEWIYMLSILIYRGETGELGDSGTLNDQKDKWDRLVRWIAGYLERESEVPS